MATPEGKVKDIVKGVLKKMGAYYFMPVQNGMGAPSVDFLCCLNGKFLAIETKAVGGHLTKRQELTLSKMRETGAVALVVAGEEEARILESTLKLSGVA